MRVLVCTVVHHPADARIYYRQIRALLDAGDDVTYIAPFDSSFSPSDVTAVTIPRAVGRHRLTALRAARLALRENAPAADIILIHDPELRIQLAQRGNQFLRQFTWERASTSLETVLCAETPMFEEVGANGLK